MTRMVQKGAVNQSVVIRIIDSTDGTPETGVVFNTTGIDLEYRREGAASVDITEVTLAALTTAHTDGGFLHIGNGYYRLDVPDAAFASGADGVLIHGTVTGMVVVGEYVQLVDYDPNDGTRLGLTALPNAAADAAGGLPISDAGGLNMDVLATRASQASVDTVDTVVDAIKLSTDNLPSDPADQSLIIAATDLIKADTSAILTDTAEIGSAGAGLTAVASQASLDALNNISVNDILTATVTESFSADGAAATLAQMLHEIRQGLLEFSISGTTLTVRRADGSTTAMTFTLDDAANPTSRTRAT